MMHKYTLNNAHYFCETADITRPFPSSHAVTDPSWEFVWNRWLAISLRNQHLPEHCPQLLQVPQPLIRCSLPGSIWIGKGKLVAPMSAFLIPSASVRVVCALMG